MGRNARGPRTISLRTQRRCRPLWGEPLETRRLLNAAPDKTPEFVADEIIVGFDGAVAAAARHAGGAPAALAEAARLTAGRGLAQPRLLAAAGVGRNSVPVLWQLQAGADVLQTIEAVKKIPGVTYAEPNWKVSIDDVSVQSTFPNDTRFGDLWGLHNTGQAGGTVDADIDAPEAWDISTGSSNIVVGVIDTGIDYNHPDLAANVWTNSGEVAGNGLDDDGNGFIDDLHGYDFANNDGDPFDDNEHGTHVSGTIGGAGNNGAGVTGVNWDVQIMGLKFLDAAGNGSTANAVLALNYAALMRSLGVNIVLTNNSWGGGGFSQALQDAIAANAAAGLLFVAAAGNGGADQVGDNNDTTPNYPSNYPVDNVVAVAALDRNNNRGGFSNFGAATVDLGAPGVAIWSSTPGNTYSSFNGTSMATPHVSGVAALAWSVNPGATYQQVRDAILNGVDPVASMNGITTTGGRLNAFNTLSLMGPPVPQPPRVTSSLPSGSQLGPISSVTVNFSEAMNQGSFSVASDVLSFTGPSAANLLPSIAGFTWVDNNTLQINFAAQSANGNYSLTLGPNILAADNNEPLDQNNNGTPGEAGDGYSANFTLNDCLGPDGFGYLACVYPYQAIDLTIGGANVVNVLDGVDDGTAAISLGAETFNFYGVNYSTVYVSSNGLITFGAADGEYLNSNLTLTSVNPAIAVLWDDLVTNNTAADAVLYRLDTVNHTLTIEWSQVQHYVSSGEMTFQAILNLSTGAAAGDIVVNYPDLIAGGGWDNGFSATVGIKDAGIQGANRLLVSAGGSSPFVQSGRAIRFTTQSTTPTGSVDLTGPTSAFRGEPLTFTLSASGSGIAPTDAVTYQIDWNGDNVVDQTVAGVAGGTNVVRAYTSAGGFNARATGLLGATALGPDVQHVDVTRYVLRANANNPNLTDLIYGGTPGVDGVFFYIGASAGDVNVFTQFENTQLVNSIEVAPNVTGKVIAFGYDSADALVGEFLVSQQALLYGGNGDDVLVGGFQGDVLDGGAGNDILIGGTQAVDGGDLLMGGIGNDLLLGHRGGDLLQAGAGEDLFVADALNFADLPTAVFALQSEWLSSRTYAERVANLSGTGIGPRNNGNFFLQGGVTVLNDAAIDTLMSDLDGATDWFIYRLTQDLLSNLEAGETQTGT